MDQTHRERLRAVKTFPSLVKYLRDELDWPIESDDFDDLTFDYRPEELGVDPKAAAKIEEIKQLRPLVTNQPWGIFFVKFEPRRLPVVALRRILRSLVVRKRQDPSRAGQATWQLHDLLFISAYGEESERQITFAQFSEDPETGDLPTLRVLGWDDTDTPLHLDHVHRDLHEKLCWPDHDADHDAWREQWSSAFTLRHREVITTSKQMALRLADLAQVIRKRVNSALAVETEHGPLRKLMKAFQEALIHDLTEDDFADMYAQTVAYGLLSARVSRPAGLVADDIGLMVPVTSPFLRELLETFLHVGGRRELMDFDELGINEVVQTLRDANMEAVLEDFGNRNPQEDPVIHFYELFLKEYDPHKRMKRGVFYTPRPVVSFMVRSVDEILRSEFGLTDGLADTTTWGEMLARRPDLKLPQGAKPDEHFVQILDPATGTGTFLVEVIEVIHNTMVARWRDEGCRREQLAERWNEYVPKHLLPRLYGFELLMAPYAIAHMKIGLKLYETGYRFAADTRVGVFLTDTLEPPTTSAQRGLFGEVAFAREAEQVAATKSDRRISVIVGNPPYSKISSNMSDAAASYIERFRYVEGVRIVERGALALELALQDDYVKFYGFLLGALQETGAGVAAFISNFGYLNSDYLRGMRRAMMETCSGIRCINLGGHVAHSAGQDADDDNVFDIEQGVAIGIYHSLPPAGCAQVEFARLWGTYDQKCAALEGATCASLTTATVVPPSPGFRFTSGRSDAHAEYFRWFGLDEMMPTNSGCIITSRDGLAIDFDPVALVEKVRQFAYSPPDDPAIQESLGFSIKRSWDAEACKAELRKAGVPAGHIRQVYYRPFDTRFIYYYPALLDTPSRPVCELMQQPGNLALLAPRVTTTPTFTHAMVSCHPGEKKCCSHDRATQMFPVWVRPFMGSEPLPNLSPALAGLMEVMSGETEPSPAAMLHFTYAILYSPSYRELYGTALQEGFPRIPLPGSRELFAGLCAPGQELVDLHLLRSEALDHTPARFEGSAPPQVVKVSYDPDAEAVRINPSCRFVGIAPEVWGFHVGGYQVLNKWLKDRGPKKGNPGRVLTEEDLRHYCRVVMALQETIRLMSEIDETIEAHGGWPGAFASGGQGR